MSGKVRAEVGRKASFQSWRVSICDKVLTTLPHLQPPRLFNGAAPRCYLLDGRTHQSGGQQVRETPHWRSHHCLVFPFSSRQPIVRLTGGGKTVTVVTKEEKLVWICLRLPRASSQRSPVLLFTCLFFFFIYIYIAEAEKKNEIKCEIATHKQKPQWICPLW